MKSYFPDTFDFAVGEREGVRRKPCPDSVYAAMEYFGANKNNTVYIGDSEVDVETARNSGIPCVAVTWGFRDKCVLAQLEPEYIVDYVNDLINILK